MAGAFEPYGASHLIAAGVGVVGAIAAVGVGRRVRDTAAELAARRWLALALPLFTLPFQVRQLLPGTFDLGSSLPIQICDLAWPVAAYALWTRSRRASALLYFWALTLTVQAILTPTLDDDVPHPEYFMYFGMHLLTIWAALFVCFGLRIGPTWAGYWFSAGCTLVWASAVMVLNALTGTNYGYLARKPAEVGSLLDLLGPWPWYVVAEAAIVLAGWALITWPWNRPRARAEPAPPAS